ncbi:hypothetical protein HPB51_012172 [Rhipicephalus microplus]|uniref:Amine oxidase domain-containing protein n=1 Tax=Rhipicephalus microplus TaxID=6941 RepID=A0A9J6DAB2_RHIMP|nr:hypothetical protein HPB51_012172 [Rhipicephalus microplus]
MASSEEVLVVGGRNEIRAQVLIIGGGVAGLTAANRLSAHGFENVMILEARDRPGGRTYSKPFGDSYIECGAQWIHGQDGNVVFQVANENGLVDHDCPYYLEQFYVWPQLTEEQHSVASEVSSLILEALDRCQKMSTNRSRNDTPSVFQKSLGHFLRHSLLDYISKNSLSSDKVQLVEACYDWAVRFQQEIQGCSCLTDVSALFFGQYRECDGNIVTELKHGYGKFVDFILQGFPSKWLQLNKCVTSVTTSVAPLSTNTCVMNERPHNHLKTSFAAVPLGSNKPVITVTCEDGSVYKADHVIVTLPLGCLKAHATHIFDPPLPEKKMLAIRSLGFGAIDKVFLKYSVPFWKAGDVFQVLWLDGFNHCGNKVEGDDMSAWVTHSQLNTSWFRYIGRFNAVHNHQDLLCAWITGEGAKYMETLSDDDVRIGCHNVLVQVLGKKDLPLPCEVERSKWYSDPYSRGSYTYISVACDSTGALPRDLAEPIYEPVVHCGTEVTYPVLFFAGEATHPHFYSTVHGAYESGIREADRLADFYFKAGSGQESCCVPDEEDSHLVKADPLSSAGLSASLAGSNPRIIIVGAGAAGLSAAYKLTQKGYTNFVVLEAQRMAGGRIQSYYYGDNRVLELGAQWVHGEEGNPLYRYALSKDLLADPRRHHSLEGRGIFCTEQGTRLPQELVDEVITVLNQIKEELGGRRPRLEGNREVFVLNELPISVGEYLRSRFLEHLELKSDTADIVKVKWAIYDWYWRFEVIDNSCYSLDELSFKSYEEFEECPGVWNINLRHGFSSVINSLLEHCLKANIVHINSLLEHIPEANIRYNKAVKRIYWHNSAVSSCTKMARSSISNSQETVLESIPFVECEDGEIMSCRHLLLTMSAGYLKQHLDDMFEPKLPDKKCQALRGIGFGTINKIFLVFEQPFWDTGAEGFQLVWLDGDSEDTADPNWWVRGISGFDLVYKNPNVLVGWIGGKAAEHMETLSDHEVLRACVHVLTTFLGRDIPEPVSIIRWVAHMTILASATLRLNLISGHTGSRTPTFWEAIATDSYHMAHRTPSWRPFMNL